MMDLRKDAETIMQAAIQATQPDAAVAKALKDKTFGKGKIILVAIGKAAWQMAKTANDILKEKIDAGIVITKYGHKKEICRLWKSGKRGIRYRIKIRWTLPNGPLTWSAI